MGDLSTLGPEFGYMIFAIFALVLIFAIAIYIYTSLAWQKIAKKRNYKYPWFAWIPYLNMVQMYQLGSLHWAWVFLSLLPLIGYITMMVNMGLSFSLAGLAALSASMSGYVNWIFFALSLPAFIAMLIAFGNVLQKGGYDKRLSFIFLGMLIPLVNMVAIIGYFVLIGMMAWGKDPVKTSKKSVAKKRN